MYRKTLCLLALLLLTAFALHADAAGAKSANPASDAPTEAVAVVTDGGATQPDDASLTPLAQPVESLPARDGMPIFVFVPEVEVSWDPPCNPGAYCRDDPDVCGPEGFCNTFSWCCMCY